MKRVLATVIVALVAAVSFSAWGQDKPATTIGWRQNWTGRFPEATPPTEWGRTLEGSVVKGLSVQAKKPKGATPDETAWAIADGFLRQFLVLGPFDPKDPDKSGLDEAFLANEADVQPDEGLKVGELEWKFLKQDEPSHVLSSVEPVPVYRALGKPKPGQVAYAHAYLHSARAGKVALMIDHTGGCRLWVNGKQVYSNAKWSIGYGWWGPMSVGRLNYGPDPRSQRVEVDLQQGWNRLLFKIVGMEMEWGRGWALLPRFIDIPPVKYQDKNIVWTAPLPDRSNANPIIVGEKIFVVSEQDELICLDKRTGKQLWHAFNNYFEATPQAERDANPAFKEIAALEEQALNAQDPEKRRELLSQVMGLLNKIDPQKFGINMESHPGGHWHSTGFTTPTPCSDGKFVYALFTSGVAACYDLDGKRQWIKRIDLLLRDPKAPYGPFDYPSGCTLVGGKFIFTDRDTFALDAKTGEIAWRAKFGLSMGPMAFALDGTDAVVASTGIFRASDGKVLWQNKDTKYVGSGGSTFVDRLLCIPISVGGIVFHVYDFADAKGEALEPLKHAGEASTPEQNRAKGDDFNKQGVWLDIMQFSAPVYHDGLMYMVDANAMLYVVDAKAGKLVYRQLLPLDLRIDVRSVAFTAPLALAGKNIYAFDNQGNCVVFEPGRQYKQVALNHIETFIDRTHTGDGWQEFTTYSSPIFEGGRIYVRGEANLYCIGAN